MREQEIQRMEIEIEPRKVAFRGALPSGPVRIEAADALGHLGAALAAATAGFARALGNGGPSSASLELEVRLLESGVWAIVPPGTEGSTARVTLHWEPGEGWGPSPVPPLPPAE